MQPPNNQFPQNIDDTLPQKFDQYRLQVLIKQIYSVLRTLISFNGPNVILSGASFGSGTSVTAVIANGICVVTHAANGYSVGDSIVLTGSSGAGTFAGLYVIISVTTNTYSFKTSASGSVTSPVEMFWFKGNRCLNPQLISNVVRNSAGQYMFSFLNTQLDAFYGINWIASSFSPVVQVSQITGGATPTTSNFTILIIEPNGTTIDAIAYMFIQLTGII